MGVLLFVGIKSVGPDLETTVNDYVKENKVSDLQVQATLGLTEKDKELAESIGDTKAQLAYSFPYVDEADDLNLQIYSYEEKEDQNLLKVTDGHLPEKEDEVVVDFLLADEFKLGDTLEIKEDTLKKQKLKIVGFVQSPLYIDDSTRGTTTVGDGQLDGFVYLPIANFEADAYSILYVHFSNRENQDIFSDEYQDLTIDQTDKLEELFKARKSERREEIVTEAMAEVDKNQAELDDNKNELADGQSQLNTAKKQLDAKKQELAAQKEQVVAAYGEEVADQQLAEPQRQLTEAEEELSSQQEELDESLKKIQAGQADIDDAKKEVDDTEEPNYILSDRDSNPGFTEFTSLSDRIDAIGNVFPVFFFFIAILITFTTITRMIEENRKEIGTLKALGYHNGEIASKYILYALLTAFIGTTLGILVGTKAIPPVVFMMLKAMYVFETYPTSFWLIPITIAIVAALIATLGSSLLVLKRDLNEKPADLLVPRAPKAGKRVFLERITPIWSRFSFNQKVTARNLLRYKSRMILTILGIAGCTGLMLAGFGLRDSIAAPAEKQFEELTKYQAIVTLDADNEASQDSKTANILADTQQVTEKLPIYSEQVSFKKAKVSKQSASLMVVDDVAAFSNYVKIAPQTKDSAQTLTDKGAIISQRLAKIFAVTVGDTLAMTDNDGNEYDLKISGITENYVGHNVYMTADYFKALTDKAVLENTYLVKTKTMTDTKESQLAKKLQDTDEVINITFMSDQIEKQASATTNMQPIVLIFIVLSGTLAFVVLYNLTNINISERERELATIKVLGFYDKEVTNYIIRENVIFTILGILFGFGIGYVLTWFIAAMASSDMVVFPLILPLSGYLISAGMTLLFTGIVTIITHFKLKRINMIGALKSNE